MTAIPTHSTLLRTHFAFLEEDAEAVVSFKLSSTAQCCPGRIASLPENNSRKDHAFCCCQEDERIEVFSRFLTEEWDVAVLTACASVYRLSEAPCPLSCIDYPAQNDNILMMDLVKVCLCATRVACLLLSQIILQHEGHDLTAVWSCTLYLRISYLCMQT